MTELDKEFTDYEIDIIRQWFNTLYDTNINFITHQDIKLAIKIHHKLGKQDQMPKHYKKLYKRLLKKNRLEKIKEQSQCQTKNP